MNNKDEIKLNIHDLEDDLEDVSDQLKKYYADISVQIINLIKEKQYEQAITILNNELDQPYVPTSIFNRFAFIRDDVEKLQKEQEYDADINSLSKLSLWDRIYNKDKHKFDVVYFNILLEKNNDEFDEIDLSIIDAILVDKKIQNVDKMHIIMTLANLGIDRNIKIANEKLNKVIETTITNVIEQINSNDELIKEVNDTYAKDPSRLNMFYELLQILIAYYLPESIPFTNQEIINSISKLLESFFNQQEIEENEINKIISSELKNW